MFRFFNNYLNFYYLATGHLALTFFTNVSYCTVMSTILVTECLLSYVLIL
jgi:hypothetical protein